MKEYILNEKTGRFVLIDGKIGKSIVKEIRENPDIDPKKKLKQLSVSKEQMRKERVKKSGCDYGYIWTSIGGNKCMDRKEKEALSVIDCYKANNREVIGKFKKGELLFDNKKVTNYKQGLAMALSSSKEKC